VLDRTNFFVRDQAAGRNPWLRREWHDLVRRTALRRRRRHTRAALGLIASGANQNNKQWQNTIHMREPIPALPPTQPVPACRADSRISYQEKRPLHSRSGRFSMLPLAVQKSIALGARFSF